MAFPDDLGGRTELGDRGGRSSWPSATGGCWCGGRETTVGAEAKKVGGQREPGHLEATGPCCLDQSSVGDSNQAKTNGAGRLGDGSAPAAVRGHFFAQQLTNN